MLITLFKSKIHRATITDADLNYVGSISIDKNLMKAADLIEYEKVQIANISNGERLETYVIEAPAGSGTIALNGAAARKGNKGDLIIIIAYGHFHKDELVNFKPTVVHVDSDNKPVKS
ncbi:MAG: aspartate 1-decarboxylase [Calditrichaeota bacterium]|nr:MAG: aspartate 1-decarboxylase [Calditrichota bacterium]